jgi:death-on-curing protein
MPAAQFNVKFLHRGIPTMGAAYLFHICKNRAFVDGNKRTALATAEMFILLNDLTLRAANHQLEALTVGIADGTITKDKVTEFFEKNIK